MLKKALVCSLIIITSTYYSCSSDDGINITKAPAFSGKIEQIKTYGGSKNDLANAVTKTVDGGYAVLGYTQSNDGDITNKTSEDFDFWLLKFSTLNQPQWNKTYGGTNDDRGSDIIQTKDGGFAILGYSKSADKDVALNAGFKDYWVAKLNSSGTILWQKSFGFSGNDAGISLIETSDNGFLITGVLDVSASNGQGNSKIARRHAGGDYWAIKLTANGEKKWSKFYGGSFTDTPYGVVETDDAGFIMVGSSDSNDVDIKANKGTYDFWVIKVANDGTLIWEKSFGGSEIDEARAITKTHDGNYLIVGDTRSSDQDVSTNKGGADLWVIKIDLDGKIIWEKSFGGSSFDVGRGVRKTQDNGFIISGSSRSSDNKLINNGQNDALVLKIDSNGNLVWSTTVGGFEIDFAYDATELNNGTIIAVGESNSSDRDISVNKGFTDALIITIK
ncbi:hypothetical protein OD91_1722 [Lutibacter sp. Hel_I_33_5]|uniref:hypothetical protein n=1 Tax=Lutibacter sp. Hel_I_33_5 TaxID=1566289 RepID=UPI0011A9666B|nr:hypothetical protein [Lutibacter sp. Hel_I_33_5]TVZ56437.1 hypothetical protein OD91_1722 [Lutibacter sp. Hel_I_33_5]